MKEGVSIGLFLIPALVALVWLIVGLIRHRTKMAAAFNAVQAEMTIRLIELVKENPFCRQLRDEILMVVRTSVGSQESEQNCIERFNRANRFQQLNVIATALGNLGHGPLVPNRVDPWGWWKVRNPLHAALGNGRLVEQICNKAMAEQATSIRLLTKPLRIIGEYVFDMETFRLEDHPLAEPPPVDIADGLRLLIETTQLVSQSIARREYAIGLLEVSARMGLPAYAKASPAHKREFLKLREILKYWILRSANAHQTLQLSRDVVEALIQRRENYCGVSVDKTKDEYWRSTPEFHVLSLIFLASADRTKAGHLDVHTIERSVRERFGSETPPQEHIAYLVNYARAILCWK